MTVPYSFATATAAIPLSQLDSNFNTAITLGNTAIQLGNTVTTLNNMTLNNVSILSGNVTITNVSVTTANVTTLNVANAVITTANVTTLNATTGNVTFANITGENVTTSNVTTLTVTNNPTFSGGTANGVLYLNGSKVATSGSALTFDGTTLTGTASGALAATFNRTASSGATVKVQVVGTDVGTIGSDVGGNGIFDIAATSSMYLRATGASSIMAFSANNAEQMRLTSTGLGIGTSSPSGKLDVDTASNTYLNVYTSNTNSAAVQTFISGATSDGAAIGYNVALRFGTATNKNAASFSEKMRLDSSGNLGLGVVPSASASGGNLYLPSTQSVIWNGIYANMVTNAYYSGSWKYIGTGQAAYYSMNTGQHQWFTAASGTAGNAISFTQAMTLDASGNLWVGTTTGANSKLYVDAGASSARLIIGYNATSVNYFDANTNIFRTGGSVETARIDSSGNLLVGTTSTSVPSNGIKLDPASGSSISTGHASGTASGTYYDVYLYNGTVIGSVTQNGTTGVLYNITSDPRLKTLVGAVTGSGERIDALQPVEFEWKADGKRARGFFADKFQEVYPDSVTGEKDGVDAEGNPVYQQMQASTAEVIADLVAELQSLRKRVAQLEGK